MINKELKHSLQNILKVWKTKLAGNKYFIKIISEYSNAPDGYITLILKNCKYGSLENLILNCGSVPENILKQITFRIIKSLEFYNIQTGEYLHSLSPDSILFDSKGNVLVNKILILVMSWI